MILRSQSPCEEPVGHLAMVGAQTGLILCQPLCPELYIN